MKLLIAILISLNVFSVLFAQDRSIMKEQSEYYSRYNFGTEQDFDKINPHSSAVSNNATTLNKHVFGWNPYWVGTAYSSYNYNLLTTVGYFSYEVDTATGGYTTIHFWNTTNLISLAHSFGVKVVLTVTNFGLTNNTRILSNPQKRQTLIDSIISLVNSRQADGVNIDFESVGSSQRANLVTFMTALAVQMHYAIPGSKVSIDLPAVDWNNSFDAAALNGVCDYMLVMGYDYYWSGSANAGPCAPLQSGGFWGAYNVTNSINYFLSNGVSANKLLLGVPYYGYDWPTVSGSFNAATTGTGTAYVYSTMKTRAGAYGRIWDNYSMTPWYAVNSGTWNEGWYDDSVSLGYKYDRVNNSNLGGIGIWALSYDGGNTDLWNEIAYKFGVNGITQTGTEIPEHFELYQNYPNPFNPSTIIKFSIPKNTSLPYQGGDRGGVLTSLKIYDILGREIQTLFNKELSPGTYEINFDAGNLPSSVYFYQLLIGNEQIAIKKMVLVK